MTTKEIEAIFREPMERIGLTYRSRGRYTVYLGVGVLGTVALSVKTRGYSRGVGSVIPYVGVRHEGIERAVAEIQGEKYHSYFPPTIAEPLPPMLAPPKSWWVVDLADPSAVVSEIEEAVGGVGLDFLRASADFAELCRLIEVRRGRNVLRQVIRWPVALAVAGRDQEAEAFVEGMADSSQSGPYRDAVLEFVAAFRAWQAQV